MSLSRKLERMRAERGIAPADVTASLPSMVEAAAPLESRIELDEPRDDESRWDAFRNALRSKTEREERRPPPAPTPLPVESSETDHGVLHRVVATLVEGHRHGDVELAKVRTIDPTSIARYALDERFLDVDVDRLLFLDTETTGLAGGAGTVPFLVGLAWFEGAALRVEQLLLRRFGEERPILERLRERVASASAIVTYNGKSFDWPLLRTRFVLHRMPIPEVPLHLDLVHGARRLLKRKLDSVRLVEVERAVLGHVREGDVDGAAIPGIYLEWQRTGRHPDMPKVIEHNALDLHAMPALLARLGARLSDLDETATSEDRLACARVAESARDEPLLRRFATRVADESNGATAAEALVMTARVARRSGDVEAEERSLLRALAEAEDSVAVAAVHLLLSKHYEHRAGDASRALEHALRTAEAEGEDAMERRASRLRKRVARLSA